MKEEDRDDEFAENPDWCDGTMIESGLVELRQISRAFEEKRRRARRRP